MSDKEERLRDALSFLVEIRAPVVGHGWQVSLSPEKRFIVAQRKRCAASTRIRMRLTRCNNLHTLPAARLLHLDQFHIVRVEESIKASVNFVELEFSVLLDNNAARRLSCVLSLI